MGKLLTLIVLGLATAAVGLAACGGPSQAEARAVTIRAEDIKFGTTSFTARVGQPVSLTLDNVGALEHSLIIDELNVKIELVPAGQRQTQTFTPASAGTYAYFCDVPGHREAGMVGTLTVNP